MTSPQNESAGSTALGQSTSELGQQAKETAGRIADEQISKQKEQATGALEQIAGAFRMTGEHLRASRQDRIARFAEGAAEQVRDFSESIRGAEPRELLRRAENLARREPALFLGGAFALGLIGARFLKSSDRPRDDARRMPRVPPLDRGTAQPYTPSRVGTSAGGGIDEDEDLRTPGEGGLVREH